MNTQIYLNVPVLSENVKGMIDSSSGSFSWNYLFYFILLLILVLVIFVFWKFSNRLRVYFLVLVMERNVASGGFEGALKTYNKLRLLVEKSGVSVFNNRILLSYNKIREMNK
jgi:hypothetical protein